MAQRALGAHWHRRTPEERAEFVRVFSDLLEQTYVDKIESYNNEKFAYMNERIDGRYAEVGSKMRTSKGEEFTLNYKLHRVGEDWRVYDLVVIHINMATYKSLFVSATSATVIPTEDGQHGQNQSFPNRALETGKRNFGTPRSKIYVAVFRSIARQDDPACGRGTIQ
jgi:hypothetical protein